MGFLIRTKIKTIIRKLLPQRYHTFARLVFEYIQSPRSTQIECPVCENSSWAFLPGGTRSKNPVQDHIIASGPRKKSFCPSCSSRSRHRLLSLYLDNQYEFDDDDQILFFAPNKGMLTNLNDIDNINCITTDLLREDVNIQSDIQKLPFKNNSFEFIICSHVLNVVEDDIQAMREIRRVLKTDGVATFMIPINPLSNTQENTQLTSGLQRNVLFCHETIVRLYGWDIYHQLTKQGFEVSILLADKFDEKIIDRYGLRKNEAIFCCNISE